MVQSRAHGLWVIGLTLFCALLLSIFPLPEWLQWLRPEWLALVLIYWVVALPQRIGVVVAFCLGLLLDSLEGAVLGQNALSLTVVAYMATLLYQRFRMYGLWQQSALVGVLVVINQLIGQWVQSFTQSGAEHFYFILPMVSSILLWPGLMLLLRHLRRHYQVS